MLLPKVAPPVPVDPKAMMTQEVAKEEIELKVLSLTMDGNLPSQLTSGTIFMKCGAVENQLKKHCTGLTLQLPRSSSEGLHCVSIFSSTNLLTFMYS